MLNWNMSRVTIGPEMPVREPIRNGLVAHVTNLVTIPFIDVTFEATVGAGIVGLVYSVIIG